MTNLMQSVSTRKSNLDADVYYCLCFTGTSQRETKAIGDVCRKQETLEPIKFKEFSRWLMNYFRGTSVEAAKRI